MTKLEILNLLNAPSAEERLSNLEAILKDEQCAPEVKSQYANNHIHTKYSFSP